MKFQDSKTNKIFNDLFWCLDSPNLINSLNDSEEQPLKVSNTTLRNISDSAAQNIQKLGSLEEHISDSFSDCENRRIGHYFEDLINFILRYQDRYVVLQRNLQLREGKKTIGEFDLILEIRRWVKNTIGIWP